MVTTFVPDTETVWEFRSVYEGKDCSSPCCSGTAGWICYPELTTCLLDDDQQIRSCCRRNGVRDYQVVLSLLMVGALKVHPRRIAVGTAESHC